MGDLPHPEQVEALAERLAQAAAAEHSLPWDDIPPDVRQAYLCLAFNEVGHYLRHVRATAVRMTASGHWSLAVEGNAVMAEAAAKAAGFRRAGAGSPTLVTLRPIRRTELDRVPASVRAEVARAIADDEAKPWGVDLYGRGLPAIWPCATRDEAERLCRTAMGGAFRDTAKPARRVIDR